MAGKKTELSENLEDYLETILALEKLNKVARVKDIAEKLGILRGSVTGALRTLQEKGLVNYEPYSFITLTSRGSTIAREITRRHEAIKDFLANILQIDSEKAEANACRMEHAMDKAAVDRLIKFVNRLHSCPRTGKDWIQSFGTVYADEDRKKLACEKCLDQFIARHKKDE